MKPSEKVLCYGSDVPLLVTRRMVLEKAGYNVVTVTDEAEFLECLRAGTPDLLLLCHSVSQAACERALQAAEPYRSRMRVLLLSSGSGKCAGNWGVSVMTSTDGPRVLLDLVARLVSTLSPADGKGHSHPSACSVSSGNGTMEKQKHIAADRVGL